MIKKWKKRLKILDEEKEKLRQEVIEETPEELLNLMNKYQKHRFKKGFTTIEGMLDILEKLKKD